MRNISHLCTRKNSQTWGQDAWKKVVVCIVVDGRKKIHARVLSCLAALGVYQKNDYMKNAIANKPVTAHLFEYTTSFGLDENLHFRYPDKGIVPTQIIFCLKEKNQKKINSHRWFFNAFAPLLKVSRMKDVISGSAEWLVSPTFASCLMLGHDQVPRVSIIFGRLSILTRMLVVHVVKLRRIKADDG